jgi:SAM-dependent methyltransferase
MGEYFVQNWRAQLQRAESADRKELIYRLARPVLNAVMRRQLDPETLVMFRPDWVLPEFGFPLIARRKWASCFGSLHGKTLLIQGTGNGWDVASWAKLKPHRIIAIDLFAFNNWQDIIQYVMLNYGVQVEFRVSSLDRLSFVDAQSIDLCASDEVFEHVSDLGAVMRETHRILKPGGLIYASYGPLWYSAGGDHFARGGIKNVFNHLLLDEPDYKRYFENHKQPAEDFQSGGRYVEIGLFSRLRTEEYLEIYQNSGFALDRLVFQISSHAVRFRKEYPECFATMMKRNPQCRGDDFMIKTHLVRLKKIGY